MVEKMNRVRLLMSAADAETAVADLQNVGVVHLSARALPGDAELADLEGRIGAYRKTLREIDSHLARDNRSDGGSTLSEEKMTAADLHDTYRSLAADLHRNRTESDKLHSDLEFLVPWGGYNPLVLSKLKDAGLTVRFHVATPKVFDKADRSSRHIEVVRRTRNQVFFLELHPGENEPLTHPERMPELGPGEIENRLRILDGDYDRILDGLRILSVHRQSLIDEIRVLESRCERRLASLSLESGAEGALRCLEGYVPVSLMRNIEAFLEDRIVFALIDEPPRPQDAPIRLKNRPAARLFEPITKMFDLPRYMELDTTPFFAPFFAFFFGLCMADVGYGALLTVAALACVFLLKSKKHRSLAVLGFLLGLSTVVGGLFLNTVFGMRIKGLPSLHPGVQAFILFPDLNDAMALSICLGVLQILFGFTMQIVNKIRQEGAIAALQPAGTFLFLAGVVVSGVVLVSGPDISIGPMPVGRWLSAVSYGGRAGIAAAVIGVFLILLFNNYRRPIWMRPLLGLWELYGAVSGLLGDVLSYIRLFALGLASGLLGGAMNLIAIMIKGDSPGLFAWIGAVLVLLIGHSVNFALAALGAFVHPLRLTFVEFYKSVGFAGGGKPYAPYGGKVS